MDKIEYDLKKALEYIPQRILQLLLEIDTLKERYKELYEEYNKIIKDRQKELMKAMNNIKIE